MLMPVIVRWVVSNTLVGGAPMRRMVWPLWRVQALHLALCRLLGLLGGAVYDCVFVVLDF